MQQATCRHRDNRRTWVTRPAARVRAAGKPTSIPPTGRIWLWLTAALWVGVAFYKPHVSRVLVFDLLVLLTFAVLLFRRLSGRGRFQTAAPSWFWVGMVGLAVAAFASGIHVWDLEFWAFEAGSLAYVTVMAFTADILAAGRQREWATIAARAFAVIALVTGLVTVLYLITGIKIDGFFEVHRGITTDKIVGPMRMCNQWASYCVTLFPVTLGVAMHTRARFWRVILVLGALLCLISVPASGSRSGGFLIVAEALGFCLVYVGLGRVRRAFARALAIGALVGLVGLTFTVAGEQFTGQPLVKRSFKSFTMIFEDEEVTDDWRSSNWERAVDTFTDHPIIGIGAGNFRVKGGDQHEIHNAYLSVLAETGLMGALPYYCVLAGTVLLLLTALLGGARRGEVDPLTVGLLVAMAGILVFGVYHNHTRQRYAWLVITFAAGYAATQVSRQRKFTTGGRRSRERSSGGSGSESNVT